MGGWTDERTDGRIRGWMDDEWINGFPTDGRTDK